MLGLPRGGERREERAELPARARQAEGARGCGGCHHRGAAGAAEGGRGVEGRHGERKRKPCPRACADDAASADGALSTRQGFARRAPFTNARIGRVGLSGRGPPRPMPTQVRSMRATMQQSRSARAALGGSAAVARHSPPRGRPQAGLDAATIKSDVRNTFFPICLLTSCIRPPALTWSIRVRSCRRACGARGSTSPSRRRCRRSSC